ncbi:MAG TPA: HAMP domain-containing sensor histidine kinase [Candidatus Dormibacteraeota bacterium]|nr:HAMP domain-containing sensor histidine kinase [Candidatus Dormibacteraeota bacterium]
MPRPASRPGEEDGAGDARWRVADAMADLWRAVSATTDTRIFFEELSRRIAAFASARGTVFWLLDADAEMLSPQPGAAGLDDTEPGELVSVPCRRGSGDVADRVVFGDQVVRGWWGAGGLGQAPEPNGLGPTGSPDCVLLPWRTRDRPLGVLAAVDSNRAGVGFSDDDVRMLRAAAAAAAVAWEHREAHGELALAREREVAGLREQIERSFQLEQLKTDFLKLASHELRGPLGVIKGYVSMMEDGTLGDVSPALAPVLPVLRAKLEEMNQLVNEMLETARLDDSALELRLARLDLREVVESAVHALEPLTGAAHSLVVDTAAEPVLVPGDRSRLGIVVTNLVHNAIKYSPRGGRVCVCCAAADGMAQVAVSDQGVGIAPEHMGLLFTRFGRVSTRETAGIPGTGLGLYLARDLARRHGGDVQVTSTPGQGSTFTLTLPLA